MALTKKKIVTKKKVAKKRVSKKKAPAKEKVVRGKFTVSKVKPKVKIKVKAEVKVKKSKDSVGRVYNVKKSGVKDTGRPIAPFDSKLFEQLCRLQATKVEIAAALKMHPETLVARVKEFYITESWDTDTYFDIYKMFAELGKTSLRRSQWKNATSNNSTVMQIWLGKQYLGQTEFGLKGESSDAQQVEFDVRKGLYGEPTKEK